MQIGAQAKTALVDTAMHERSPWSAVALTGPGTHLFTSGLEQVLRYQ